MDNPTRWNITNSAQNIVSALVDPSKQFDGVFKREWSTTFAGFHKQKLTIRSKTDSELKTRLTEYVGRLKNRCHIKAYEVQQDKISIQPQESNDRTVVPEIFLREDFDLSNPGTFSEVILASKREINSETCETNNSNEYMTTLCNHHHRYDTAFQIGQYKHELLTRNQLKELQQSLTDYLDIIEEKLASQISNRSGDFFQVMSSVDSVMDELSSAIKSVTNLRKKCAHLNTSIVIPNMKCIHLNRTRDNAQSVLTKMNEIAYLCKVQPMIQILLSASDFVGALDLIAKSRIMLHKDLTRVICLRHLESQLNEIERMIGTMMQQEFLTLISSEWDGSLNQQTSAASRLSKLFDYFANGYTEIPERGSLTLLSLLQIQAEKFVNQFHEERKKRVESTLDIELWKVVEVPNDFQRLVTMIVDEKLAISDIFSGENMQQLSLSRNSSEASVAALIDQPINGLTTNNTEIDSKMNCNNITSTLNIDQLTTATIGNASSLKLTENSCKPGRLTYAKAGGSTFVIVNSVINLVRTIMDYCKCAHDIRSLSTDLLERLFKILLLFNTKTYHLVYSAGAIQVAGLKSITTRSLIVSQRSLKLIILLIPSIRRHFARLLPDRGDKRLKRFDEIRSIYEEHAAKIPERVKTVVRDVIDLQLQDWEAKPPVPSQQFNSVSQHLARLHDNIQDALPHDDLVLLFSQLSETFKDVLVGHLKRLNMKPDAGPQQWLVTQELTFYRISLSKLGAFSAIELNFDDLWSRLAQASEENNVQRSD